MLHTGIEVEFRQPQKIILSSFKCFSSENI